MEATAPFFIRRVRLRHYRSIGACDVALGPLTLLVGPNGSGKSNFLDSLRFVSQALNENLDNALRERGGPGEVRRRSAGHPTHFGIEFVFEGPGFGGVYKFQIGATKGGDFAVSHESCAIDRTEFGSGRHEVEVRDGALTSSSIAATLPRPSHDRLFLVSLSGLEEFRPIYDGLAGMNVFNINPEAIRQPQKPDPGDAMLRDGSNLASVLENLRRRRPQLKTQVEEYLKHIVPGIEAVNRKALGNWETVEFRQLVEGDARPWTFQSSSMSDGTLRALGVLMALFAVDGSMPAPVGIEEPESALHPAAAGLLLEAIRGASEMRQVLVTSHSPDLLDSPSLGPDEVLAVRAERGTTTVARLDAAGARALREGLFTPGELLRVDQLHPAERPHQLELFA